MLNAEFLCLWEPATLERRQQIARELGRFARATGDPQVEFLSGFFAAYCQAECGDLDGSRSRLLELGPLIDTTKNQYFAFLTERLVLSIDMRRCVPGVQDRVDGLLQRFNPTHADTDGTWALQTGLLAYQAGTLDQMLHALQAMTAGTKAKTWTAAHAIALLWAGDLDGAEEILDRNSDNPRNYFWMAVAQASAEVAAGLGRRDHCRQMFDELLPYRGRVGITGGGSLCFGLVSRSLDMLALALDDLPVAVDILSEAVEQADRIGALFDAVAGRRLLATALLASESVDRAHTLIADALDVAERQCFTREIKLIRALAASASAVGSGDGCPDRFR